MNKRKVNALQKQLHRHARNNCVNHSESNDCSVTQHGKCVLSIEVDRPTANVCPYFIKSVAPSNPELLAEYMEYFPDDYPLKPRTNDADADHCSKCNTVYDRTSNRQIYCTECAYEIRREKERIRQQKRRG